MSDPSPASPKTERKLLARDWLEIIGMAKDGVPVAKIAKLYKVRPSTIYRGLKKRSVKIGGYVSSAQEIAEGEQRKELVERIKQTKDQDYKRTVVLQSMVTEVIADAKKKGNPIASVQDDVKTLKLAIDAIANGTKNKWIILGLDRENDGADAALPELPIRELTDHEIAAIRDKQLMEDDVSDEDLLALDGEDELEGLEDDVDEGADENESV